MKPWGWFSQVKVEIIFPFHSIFNSCLYLRLLGFLGVWEDKIICFRDLLTLGPNLSLKCFTCSTFYFQMESTTFCLPVTCTSLELKKMMPVLVILAEFVTHWQTMKKTAHHFIWQLIVSILLFSKQNGVFHLRMVGVPYYSFSVHKPIQSCGY